MSNSSNFSSSFHGSQVSYLSDPNQTSQLPKALLLNASPSFQEFDRPLMRYLSWQVSIARWEYYQTPDEPSDLEVAVNLLHEYLESSEELDRGYAAHLIGHGVSGLVGLLYARRYPDRVKSLTLLSVGCHPGLDWQSFYYAHLKLLPCSRQNILRQMVNHLFGSHPKVMTSTLMEILEQDLLSSPSPHSLWHSATVPQEVVGVPTLFCGGSDDAIVSPHELQGWQQKLGELDQIWQCPGGKHFFQYFYPHKVARQILSFWLSLNAINTHNVNQSHLAS
jgi:pimeloyl-ACP methyl ester carboxylesterase